MISDRTRHPPQAVQRPSDVEAVTDILTMLTSDCDEWPACGIDDPVADERAPSD